MIKLKPLVKEAKLPTPKDDTDAREYAFDFAEFVGKKIGSKKIKGFEADYDRMVGSLGWYLPNAAFGVFCWVHFKLY